MTERSDFVQGAKSYRDMSMLTEAQLFAEQEGLEDKIVYVRNLPQLELSRLAEVVGNYNRLTREWAEREGREEDYFDAMIELKAVQQATGETLPITLSIGGLQAILVERSFQESLASA